MKLHFTLFVNVIMTVMPDLRSLSRTAMRGHPGVKESEKPLDPGLRGDDII